MAHVAESMSRSMRSNAETMYEGGDETWYDGVVTAQKQVMEKAGLESKY